MNKPFEPSVTFLNLGLNFFATRRLERESPTAAMKQNIPNHEGES